MNLETMTMVMGISGVPIVTSGLSKISGQLNKLSAASGAVKEYNIAIRERVITEKANVLASTGVIRGNIANVRTAQGMVAAAQIPYISLYAQKGGATKGVTSSLEAVKRAKLEKEYVYGMYQHNYATTQEWKSSVANYKVQQQLLQTAKQHKKTILEKIIATDTLVGAEKKVLATEKQQVLTSLANRRNIQTALVEAKVASSKITTGSNITRFLSELGITTAAVVTSVAVAVMATITAITTLAFKQAVVLEGYKKKLESVFVAGAGDPALKWARAFALSGKATLEETVDALTTLSRLHIKPTPSLIESIANVAILTKRSMDAIATGISFGLQNQWFRMQRGTGITRAEVMAKAKPGAFDIKTGKVLNRALALQAIETAISTPGYKGVAERFAGGTTGIIRQILAFIKDTLGQIGTLSTGTVTSFLNNILSTVKTLLPPIVLLIKGLVIGLTELFNLLVKLVPVLIFAATAFGVFKLFMSYELITTGIRKIIFAFKALTSAELIAAAAASLLETILQPWMLVKIIGAIAATAVIFTVAVPAMMNKISSAFTTTGGALGDIKNSTDDVVESVENMYHILYSKSKEQLDLISKSFDLVTEKWQTVATIMESLNINPKVAKEQELQSAIKELNHYQELIDKTNKGLKHPEILTKPKDASAIAKETNKFNLARNRLRELTSRQTEADALRSYLTSKGYHDFDDEITPYANAMEKIKSIISSKDLALVKSHKTIRDTLSGPSGATIIPYTKEEIKAAEESVNYIHKHFSQKAISDLMNEPIFVGEVLKSKQSVNNLTAAIKEQKGVISESIQETLNSNLLTYQTKHKNLMLKISSLYKDILNTNKESVKQTIMGGGSLGKLGISRWSVWGLTGNNKLFPRGFNSNINLDVRGGDVTINDLITNATKKILSEYVRNNMQYGGSSAAGSP